MHLFTLCNIWNSVGIVSEYDLYLKVVIPSKLIPQQIKLASDLVFHLYHSYSW